jgi:TrmH family RNA methyltransferase
MKTISSRQNAIFRRVRDAVRDHADEIVIEGPKAVADAIRAGWTAHLYVIPSVSEGPEGEGGALDHVFGTAHAAGSLAPARDDVVSVSEALFNDISDTRTSQGVVALFERPRATLDELFSRDDSVVVALDGVQDPGNVGTIVRLAAAFDAAGVALLPGCADPFGPKAIRASAGAILNVACAAASVDELLARGWPLFAADARGKHAEPPARRAVLVFGSEGTGLSDAIAHAAHTIAIPMSARIESLNVAASAAILLARSFALR